MTHLAAHGLSLSFPVYSKLEVGTDTNDANSAGAGLESSAGRVTHVDALKNVSFKLGPGDRLGIVGRNGSGKSTLLRVLAGVYEPTNGYVESQGQIAPLFNVGLGTRRESTGRQNIILRGLIRGLSRAEAADKVQEIADFSGLGHFLDMPVRFYSTGMAMRLSFAIATSFDPEILLLDEWIGAGDEDFREKARTRMNSLVADAGITVIASHNRQLLKSVCNLGLWLDRGIMRALGPLEDVYRMVDDVKAKTRDLADGKAVARAVQKAG